MIQISPLQSKLTELDQITVHVYQELLLKYAKTFLEILNFAKMQKTTRRIKISIRTGGTLLSYMELMLLQTTVFAVKWTENYN